MTDVAAEGVKFPTRQQKIHWKRIAIRRLEAHILRLQADLEQMKAQLAAMEDTPTDERREYTFFWAFQDCRSEKRRMTFHEMNELFVRDPLVQTVYDDAAGTVPFMREKFDRRRVEAVYGTIPASLDAMNPWDVE